MYQKGTLKKAVDLFLISFLALYFEVLFIRWIPSSVQIIAYFANVILISAFLGLGLGCMLAEIKFNLMSLFPACIFTMVVLLLGFNNVEVQAAFLEGEHLLGFYGTGGINLILLIIIIFAFNTLMFVPLGQGLGISLKSFKPLVSYSINIAGSITGVIVFSFLSYLMLNPVLWFILGLTIALWFYVGRGKQFFYQILIGVAAILVVAGINPHSFWSPYYKIDIKPYISGQTQEKIGYYISANNTHHQYAYNLTEESVNRLPELRQYKDIYEFPYKLKKADSVLILGAGSGNDASASLRMGARDISAVEIDPLIASLGKSLHEERPYLSKSVDLFVDDARSFIRRSDKKFDLITFGYLDAHKVLSQFSSVRLDNFIYTQESFQDMKEHLSSDGLVSLTYLVFREWIGAKLYATMKNVFGDELKVVRATTYNPGDTAIYLAGPRVKDIVTLKDPAFKFYKGFDVNAEPISDDWPYLYLVTRNIPKHYLIILSCVLMLSLLSVFFISSAPFRKFNTHFFFLGAGFMLLETVCITRFALLFGATWMVNSAVIISILVMALFANLIAAKAKSINPQVVYALLIASIFLNWFLKPDFYLSFNRATGIILSSLVLSLPLLFAGLIFANSFKSAKDIPSVFAYNLLGAIAGGFCEYISMSTGFRLLFVVAVAMYCLSYLGLNKKACQI